MKLREFVQRHCRNSDLIQLSQCLNCHGNRVARGKIIPDDKPLLPVVFDPSGRQACTFTLGGTRFTSKAMACLDCGFAWTSTSPEKLRKFIQKHCDQTPGNAVAFEGVKPPSAWKEMWIGGIGMALIPVGYGVYCLYTGHAYFPRRHGPVLDLQGWEAVVLAVAYIAFGAFLHFKFYWGRHPRLRSWSPHLKLGALLVVSLALDTLFSGAFSDGQAGNERLTAAFHLAGSDDYRLALPLPQVRQRVMSALSAPVEKS